ncbi:hypothetical protein ACIB24_14750 [Spongisporangium articulatum]|uniref:TetR family transcriptional regulator n=1 Tax=Spongisporangium articulatum TaxID=3362603 RepID=A0ABW8APM7_9ACTN
MPVALGAKAEQVVPTMVDAMLARDGQAWADSLGGLSSQEISAVMSAAFAAAVYRRWPEDPSLEEIAGYATSLSSAPGEKVVVAASTIEAGIRAALGEMEMLNGISAEDRVPAYLLVIHAIQDDGVLGSHNRDEYVAEIIDAVA